MEMPVTAKCFACGCQTTLEELTCQECGSENLLERRQYVLRLLTMGVLATAVVLLVLAMIFGEIHRAVV